MKKQKKDSHKGLHLSKNKRYYGFFTILLTGLLVIASTFSWVSWYEWKKNHLQGEVKLLTPQVRVKGALEAQILTHQQATERQITVKNTGQVPVFIRVSLAEILMKFEIDTTDKTGNGHLKMYGGIPIGGIELQKDVMSTWLVGNYFNTPGTTDYLKSTARQDYSYLKTEEGRPQELLPIILNFGEVDPLPTPLKEYWLYQVTNGVGYYYYSDIVGIAGETKPLVTTTELNVTAPNNLKGSLHHLEVKATGGEVSSGIYSEWQIPELPGNKLYDRYQQLLTQ